MTHLRQKITQKEIFVTVIYLLISFGRGGIDVIQQEITNSLYIHVLPYSVMHSIRIYT